MRLTKSPTKRRRLGIVWPILRRSLGLSCYTFCSSFFVPSSISIFLPLPLSFFSFLSSFVSSLSPPLTSLPALSLQAALQACQNGSAGIMDGSNGDGFAGAGAVTAATGQEAVLHVTIENMVYPVTLETLAIIFKKYGPVQKILTFTKNNKFQVGPIEFPRWK